MVGMSQDNQHVFLDDVDAEEALEWVKQHNKRTLKKLDTKRYRQIETEILEALDSPDRIPFGKVRGEHIYNFWTDAEHPRGLWRRQSVTTYLEDNKSREQHWETLLDVDELSNRENRSWVWAGAQLLFPTYDRALISLSDGGSDTHIVREFDMNTKEFVEDGFTAPPSKGGLSWIDRDTLWASVDLGSNTLTESGYCRQVRRWKRGTDLNQAELVYECETKDVGAWVYRDHTPGWQRDWIIRSIDTHHQQVFVIEPAQPYRLREVPCPKDCTVIGWRDWLLFMPRQDWDFNGKTFSAGSLLASPLDEFLAGVGQLHALFTPTPTSALEDVTLTRHHVVVTVLQNVVTRLGVLTPPRAENSGWDRRDLDLSKLPKDLNGNLSTLSVAAFDPMNDDRLWYTSSSFTQPTTLSILELTQTGAVSSAQMIDQAPQLFDAENLITTQHFATSEDGTKVPYFLIRSRRTSGPTPTILYGYGGFEFSLTPNYMGAAGRAWLARGGAYAIANIRGGGEYGPQWHQAALRENRHRAYEDFAAVATDLVEHKVTTRDQLAAYGGSNGGLLTGMMLTNYPHLFGAIGCRVPLLDMRRYHTLLAGASWVGEYGNPDDPADWEFLRTFSPYHLWRADGDYPPILFTTSTRDDRVHPAHARTMVAQMHQAGQDVWFYENTEGGHAGAADNSQRARMEALIYEFFWQHLSKEDS